MRKYKIGCLCCFLLGCTPADKIEVKIPLTISSYAERIAFDHQNISIQPIDMTVYGTEVIDSQNYQRVYAYMMDNRSPCNPVRSLTIEQAYADVDSLFLMLKVSYGNYETFGGDAAFQQAKNTILEEVTEQEELPYTQFSEIVRAHLAFVNDYHVQIDRMTLQAPIITYESEKRLSFKKKDSHYYLHDKEIQHINHRSDLGTYLKPQLQTDGTIIYRLFYQSIENQPYASIQYSDGSSEDISLMRSENLSKQDSTIDVNMRYGIPYVHLNSMVYTKENTFGKKTADEFYDTASEFKHSKTAILDLRGNTGGNMFLVEEWCKRFAGRPLQGAISSLLRLPLDDVTFLADSVDISQDMEELQSLSLKKVNELTYQYPTIRKKQSNDTLLFVLQDGNTISAAEHMIDRLHMVDNVIFVGTPTRGALRGSSFMRVFLKESGMEISLGNMRNSFDESYAREYYGIIPDIWVSSDNALEYVYQLLEVAK